jgi:hypothetical protein
MSAEFELLHDAYLDAWQNAFATGDPIGLEAFLADDYHGVFATAPETWVSVDARVAIAGVAESVRTLRGAVQRVDRRLIGRRSDGAVCVFYVKTISAGGQDTGAFVTENWARTADGRWLLQREAVEHGVSPTDRPARA